MQEADRKLAWSAVVVLAVIAVELAWFLFVGPENYAHHATASHATQQAGDQDYPWWQYSGAWIAIFTIVLTGSTGALWWVTWQTLLHAKEDAARRAGESAAQIELSRKQFLATHRPDVIVRRIELIRVPNAPPRILVHFANVGTVTAEIVHVTLGVDAKDWNGIRWRGNLIASSDGRQANVVSGGFHVLDANLRRMPIPLEAVDRGDARLFVFGGVIYRDELHTGRTMGFIRWYDAQFDRFQKVPEEWAHSEFEYAD